MATTEHVKSTDPMDAVDVRLTEVNYGVAYGLAISFRDGKRFGVFLPKDATQEEIVRRMRMFADSIDACPSIYFEADDNKAQVEKNKERMYAIALNRLISFALGSFTNEDVAWITQCPTYILRQIASIATSDQLAELLILGGESSELLGVRKAAQHECNVREFRRIEARLKLDIQDDSLGWTQEKEDAGIWRVCTQQTEATGTDKTEPELKS